MNKDFQFDEKQHVYTLNGKRLYGITSVLGVIAKPALIQWSANMAVEYIEQNFPSVDEFIKDPSILSKLLKEAKTAHRKKKESAGDFGTNVHKAVEHYILGKEIPPLAELEQRSFDQFKAWAEENKVKFLATEKRMFSETMWTAGTADMILEIDGKKYLGDLKTSSGIYDRTYFFQCAGYRLMAEEMGEADFHGSIIVRCGKKGDFEVAYSYDYEADKQGFLSALALFKALEQK